MATILQSEALITAEEYALLPDPGYPTELVEGRIVPMTPPRPYHGYLCVRVLTALHDFVRQGRLGLLVSNDSAVRTQRGPDTVRGADIAFYRAERIPGGAIPNTPYLDVSPDLVVEVLSPSDRWPNVLRKVWEYLEVGVTVVVVVDPDHRSVHVYSAEAPVRIIAEADVLTLPEVLPGFEVAVKDLFDA